MPYPTRANQVARRLEPGLEYRLRSQQIKPEEVFFPEDIQELRKFARARIVETFHRAYEHMRGKDRSTDNYIVNVGRRPSELAKHIASKLRYDFIDVDELGGHVAQWPLKMKLLLVDSLQYHLILDEINALINAPQHGLYFLESHGLWQLVQSVIDELPRPHERTPKIDRRNYHGRPRNQTQSRGIPGGVSTSWSPAC